ncbi:MAG: tetratricopeptide repeat protein [Cyanobacteria bacterium TGS_CYA1]|nr:tetratricopeptide repeat protein [Cyanobacteria bacterium TGS_CYA1]
MKTIYIPSDSPYFDHFDIENRIKTRPRSDDYIVRGCRFEKKNKFPEALMDYTTAIKLNPKGPEAYLFRSRLYKKMKATAKADADLAMVNKLDPKFIELDRKARTHFNDPLAELKADAIERFPFIGPGRQGKIELQKGNYDGAIKLFTASIQLYSSQRKEIGESEQAKYIEANLYCNRAYANIKKNEFSSALADLDKCLEIYPNYPEARKNRAKIYSIQGKKELAQKEMELAKQSTEELRKQVMTRTAEQNFRFDSSRKTSTTTKAK